MLTPRQRECWAFLHAYSRQHGCAPTFEEIAAELNVASKSSVHRLLKGLEERGFIRRLRHRRRAIELIRTPEAQEEQS